MKQLLEKPRAGAGHWFVIRSPGPTRPVIRRLRSCESCGWSTSRLSNRATVLQRGAEISDDFGLDHQAAIDQRLSRWDSQNGVGAGIRTVGSRFAAFAFFLTDVIPISGSEVYRSTWATTRWWRGVIERATLNGGPASVYGDLDPVKPRVTVSPCRSC